jgi:hypothetical protein
MLEVRKEAGTAYRDLGHYGSRLQGAIASRTVDSLVAELVDGRIVNVSYRPTQNGSWVSTHEDITEPTQNEARIAHLAFNDELTGLPKPGSVQRTRRQDLPDRLGRPIAHYRHLVTGAADAREDAAIASRGGKPADVAGRRDAA